MLAMEGRPTPYCTLGCNMCRREDFIRHHEAEYGWMALRLRRLARRIF